MRRRHGVRRSTCASCAEMAGLPHTRDVSAPRWGNAGDEPSRGAVRTARNSVASTAPRGSRIVRTPAGGRGRSRPPHVRDPAHPRRGGGPATAASRPDPARSRLPVVVASRERRPGIPRAPHRRSRLGFDDRPAGPRLPDPRVPTRPAPPDVGGVRHRGTRRRAHRDVREDPSVPRRRSGRPAPAAPEHVHRPRGLRLSRPVEPGGGRPPGLGCRHCPRRGCAPGCGRARKCSR